ncbi:MAG: hypothetical protein ACNA8W_16025 [Bradymonadaceae bacterium]
MTTAAPTGILDNLVTQFSTALDCFRELVQNSIDAGAQAVEVYAEYVGETGDEGSDPIQVEVDPRLGAIVAIDIDDKFKTFKGVCDDRRSPR